jgi:hypothetical protein
LIDNVISCIAVEVERDCHDYDDDKDDGQVQRGPVGRIQPIGYEGQYRAGLEKDVEGGDEFLHDLYRPVDWLFLG